MLVAVGDGRSLRMGPVEDHAQPVSPLLKITAVPPPCDSTRIPDGAAKVVVSIDHPPFASQLTLSVRCQSWIDSRFLLPPMAVCTAARSSSACGSFLLLEEGIRLEAAGFAGGGFIAYRGGAEGGAEGGTSTLIGNAPVDVPPGPVAVKV